jgi:hypothetical protein
MSTTTTETALALAPAPARQQQITAFANESAFEAAQRMARALTSSQLVPQTFRGAENTGSALIALEIAQRIGASPLMVMQNLNVIHGRPAWSSQFIIAALNSCGRFSPIRFDVTGEGDNRQCIAWAYDSTGKERLDGPAVSIATAKAEGWYSKTGSKWQTMPELMLRYRAAAFFGRLYAPDILMGMQSVEEIVDVNGQQARQVAAKEAPKVSFKPANPTPDEDVIDGEIHLDVTKDILFVDSSEPTPPAPLPTTKKELGVLLKKKMEQAQIPKEKLLTAMSDAQLAPEGATMFNQLSSEDMQVAILNWDKLVGGIGA